MRILLASPEAVPFAKTGGLADVAGALLPALRKKKVRATLILPLYTAVRENTRLSPTGRTIRVSAGQTVRDAAIYASDDSPDPRAYFIECDEFFARPELYGTPAGPYPDNAVRFGFFSLAVLEACLALDLRPDVIHCHDWQTALIPLYLRTVPRFRSALGETAVVFTIHNLGYQGIFDAAVLPSLGLGPGFFTTDGLEFYGSVNFMKAGLLYADLLSTVSMTYAREILEEENGFGLDGVLRMRKADLSGILNGIDEEEWDPGSDPFVRARYRRDGMTGKSRCRSDLLERTGLSDRRRPLIGIVSRLSSQKGIDLVVDSVDVMADLGVNLAILGSGEERYQRLLSAAARRRASVFLSTGFDDRLAHMIYAGSDFFLMPSRYEPCGLSQLIAMRYGTIPIARKTGGLADTVADYNHLTGEGTGFLFSDYTAPAMVDAVKRALCAYSSGEAMKRLIRNAMAADFSWERAAGQYVALYRRSARKVRG